MVEMDTDQIARLAAWVKTFEPMETPRMVARPFRADDAELLYEALKNERVNRWIGGFEQPFDVSAARRWLAPRLERMERGEGVYGGVFYREPRMLMGFFYAVVNIEGGGVEIAGALNELYWGKGFVEEFSFALVNEVLRAGAPSVLATCARDNFSSMRVLQTLNFEQEAFKTIPTPQGPRESWVYRLTPERWSSAMVMPLNDGVPQEEVTKRRRELLAMCRELKTARDYIVG